MKNPFKLLLILLLLKGSLISIYCQQDVAGSKDYLMLNRMPGFYIYQYEKMEFNTYSKFINENGKSMTVEGRYHFYKYAIKKDAIVPSYRQILKNYSNAVVASGGKIVYDVGGSDVFLQIKQEDKTIWIRVWARDTNYELVIVEEEKMRQDIALDINTLLKGIRTDGKIAIYDILFDFNDFKIRKESEATLEMISNLLIQNPTLKVFVVGHTDNTGEFDYNLELSKNRANEVVNWITSNYQIDKNRLIPFGIGPLSPVASNDTEEGRHLNRRVELVKQ